MVATTIKRALSRKRSGADAPGVAKKKERYQIMKKQYAIIKHSENGLFVYNEDFNIFGVKHGTIYTNKREAIEKMKYARIYASGLELNDVVDVIELNNSTNTEKRYITYEEPFVGRTFTFKQMKEVYRDLADKKEYPDFITWLTDMLKSGVFEEV